jgi:hypothetical protein
MLRHLALLHGALALAALHVDAQDLIVDPTGSGGAFTSLQAAIDAAPSGASIEVRGGTYTAIRIAKSLRIVGAPAPLILPGSNAQPGGGSRNEPAIWLQGNGSDRLQLANLRTGGTSDGNRFAHGASGIAGGGFAEVALHDCVVRGAPWVYLTGIGTGSPGIELTGNARLTVVRSAIFGGPSDADYLYANTSNGAAGIEAPTSTVIAIDATIEGGEGCFLGDRFGGPPPTPCPCAWLTGGHGGTGLIAARAFLSGSSVRGGLGATVLFNPCYPSTCFTPWGRQPDGAPYALGERRDLPRDLLLLSAPRLGGLLDLAWPGAHPAPVLLVASPGAPLDLGALGFFFGELTTLQTLPTSWTGSLQIPIPADPLLYGLPLALQLYYPSQGNPSRAGLSRPLLELLR